ncbi:DNA mismatch repair protein MutT [Candidatus Woesearchaeota archaeon CG10_big_fil_rev_8_21_14_0_10_36_11]|nr:MAG: DNA mismatch repair protein MutT [Candidatus Woesearchaeota archaeon CG10_big_fil_rev_8_21_14_0_10_36_11]
MDNFRVAAKSFIVNDGKLLIVKRRSNDVMKPSMWEIPGGRLELGENPFDGVKRETHEETGLDINVLHPMSVRHFTRSDNQTITMLVFLCKALNDTVTLSEEHTAYEWVDMSQAKDKLGLFFHDIVDTFHTLELQKHLL